MGIKQKPKVLRDLYSNRTVKPFWGLQKRVNLQDSRIFRLPLVFFAKALIIFGVFSYLVFGSALAPVSQNQLTLAAQNNNEEERQKLEKQLEELEAQIAKDQETIDKYKSEGKNLQSEIDRLNAKINKLNLQIKAINLSLQKLDKEISQNKNQILTTEQKIEQNKAVLSRALQNIYESENVSIAEILLRRPQLSDFFADLNNLVDIQESLRGTLEKVINLRDELLDEQEQLAVKRNDAERLKAYQDSQRVSLSSTKSEKAEILKVTKGNEEKYKALVKDKQKTAAQIRSQIFKLLGGGELPFEEAVKFADFASKATGVRPAFILAVLTQESSINGVIGKNLGRCYYNDPWPNPERKVMRLREASVFEILMGELGLNPAKTPVSCPINRDGLYGGATGPAQFMPSTWKIYKDRVSEITGNSPASPFNNGDAFIATALYLKDAGAANASLSQERIAAARYYAGGNYRRHIWGYGDQVVTRAQEFQKDIDILNS